MKQHLKCISNGRGADSAHPYKNQFRGHFNPNLSHILDLGTKITLENFFKLGF